MYIWTPPKERNTNINILALVCRTAVGSRDADLQPVSPSGKGQVNIYEQALRLKAGLFGA